MTYDQKMIDDLLDYLIRMVQTEHGMDGCVKEAAKKAAAIRAPMFKSVRNTI